MQENIADRIVVETVGNAIRTDEHPVAGVEPGFVDVGLDVAVAADRLLKLGTARVLFGLFLTQDTEIDHAIDPGLVACHLPQLTAVHLIGPAVADVSYPE